ncbi:dehydrogenase [Ferviditalea candida]|uniref:Dehydrogenase n=1 Tax=Ferviditalea candida TaxID=3108399 RepID=A0ABU5ZI61_9BACL|nr:dehydrogenase [Paenibacillaceae bacterium T2]
MDTSKEKHQRDVPSAREVRRACNRELFRTMKRLKIWIPPDQIVKAEEIYFHKVIGNLPWIIESRSNRKALSDWWEENVAPEIAELWSVELHELSRAFRDAFGG